MIGFSTPFSDGKTKLEHVKDMLNNFVYQKHLEFHAVLMDSWYATKEILLFIEQLQKYYYCPKTYATPNFPLNLPGTRGRSDAS